MKLKRKRGDEVDKKALVSYRDPRSPAAEAYRTLRTNIEFTGIDEEITTLGITSTTPREGKSTVVSNLAVSYAMAEMSTLILDCDLRKPTQHKIFELSNSIGLTTYLRYSRQGVNLERYLQPTQIKNLWVMNTGPLPPNPAELLGSAALKDFIVQVQQKFERVVIDSPPVMVAADTSIISTHLDGLVMVFDHGEVKKDEAQEAMEQLNKAKAPIIGAILNSAPIERKQYYYYYQYYYTDSFGD